MRAQIKSLAAEEKKLIFKTNFGTFLHKSVDVFSEI